MAYYICGSCRAEKVVDDEHIGKKGKCPKCENINTVVATRDLGIPTGKISITKPMGFTNISNDKGPMEGSKTALKERSALAEEEALANPNVKKVIRLDEFIDTALVSQGRDKMQIINDEIAEINLNQKSLWIKSGCLLLSRGRLNQREEFFTAVKNDKGFFQSFETAGLGLTSLNGEAKIFLGDQGKKLHAVLIKDEVMIVNGNNIVAFEEGLTFSVNLDKGTSGLFTEKFVSLTIEGTGHIIISSAQSPLGVEIVAGQKYSFHPHATILWAGQIEYDFTQDSSFSKNMQGKTCGDSFQLNLTGVGHVLVQPLRDTQIPSGQFAHAMNGDSAKFWNKNQTTLFSLFFILLIGLLGLGEMTLQNFVVTKNFIGREALRQKAVLKRQQANKSKNEQKFAKAKEQLKIEYEPRLKEAGENFEKRQKVLKQFQEDLKQVQREIFEIE